MIGRITLVGLIVTVLLAWMLADLPRGRTLPMPSTPKVSATPAQTPSQATPLEIVELPPPPAANASTGTSAETPADTSPVPARMITPLVAREHTVAPVSDVKPLQAAAPQSAEPPALTPLQPEKPAQATADMPVEIAPLKPQPKPASPVMTRPQPEPQAEPQPTPMTAQPKKAMPQPALAKAASAQPTPPDTKKAATDGRPLLRLLEHGEGPSVEIAWPSSAAERRHLYRVFRQCYGMEIAVMDAGGKLYGTDDAPGTAWDINMDRFSGFVRQSSGGAALDEHETARQIRDRHGIAGMATVRLFPRAADALLLGGLKHLIGENYAGNARIRARYEVSGWHVGVSGLSVNAEPIAGRVDLSAAARRNCSI